MRRMIAASLALFVVALAAPAFAGGDMCAGHSKSKNTAASAEHSADQCAAHGKNASASMADGCCSAKGMTTAWSGAWLERSEGALRVAAIAPGSPAARSGLRQGDVVLAVNGYHLGNESGEKMCPANRACTVGSSVVYKVQRGRSTKSLKLKLTSLPAEATARYAERQAAFDPDLAAVVMVATR